MREILFRAKRIDNSEWVEGNLIILKDDYEKITAIIISIEYHWMFEEEYSGDIGFMKWYEVAPETLCQYTGLKDKNGNRIWENDIVKISTGVIGKVIWHDETAGYCLSPNNDSDDFLLLSYWVNEYDVEVIGNVFDDKNLLAETDYRREQEKETED